MAIVFLFSCTDNPSLEFLGEDEWLEKWFPSSSAKSSSSSEPSSSSSACTAKDNDGNYYCSNGSLKKYEIVVTYPNIKQKAVIINGQTWMAENLKSYRTEYSSYGNNDNNYNKYGAFYKFDNAKNACPENWHLPSMDEWMLLIDNYEIAGKKLKAIEGWDEDSNGEDIYGFTALPGGYSKPNSGDEGIGYKGVWWSSSNMKSEQYNEYYGVITLTKDDFAEPSSLDKEFMASVRCVKDK